MFSKTFTTSDIEHVAEHVVDMMMSASSTTGALVVTFSGELGAGKTTLIQSLARQFGIVEQLPSPTFTIMRVYHPTVGRFTRFVHMDAYRIEREDELRPLRFFEYLTDPQTVLCIEWPERIPHVLSKEGLHIQLAYTAKEGERTIIVKS